MMMMIVAGGDGTGGEEGLEKESEREREGGTRREGEECKGKVRGQLVTMGTRVRVTIELDQKKKKSQGTKEGKGTRRVLRIFLRLNTVK